MNVENTLNATVFTQLREDILAGKLKPGERLRTETLRQRYDVGGSPVREALMRLEAEGFVLLEQNKGFSVAGVSLAHLEDLTASRIEIEAIALRWSVERGKVDWEVQLIGAMHRLASVSKGAAGKPYERNTDWMHYHRDFHRALVAGCGSQTLIEIRQRLFDQAERYVALSISAKGEIRDDVAEHQGIMGAAIDRDVELTLRLNREHIERTTEKLKHQYSF
ncbi:MAG: FCD domain-containing protein [Pelagibacterium sp.]|jgi:DNA-binding GntR family transcriptional regulator|uniref:GntR family transcriptional regulator n=1 Tax=Pelagibacterium sp. TaxID=1967288 RepID=UPI0032EF437F|tara:strand:- start:51708 stop:52370 length:663 start_codon:yes stop_codon:yes gene_type:complete